MVSGQEEEKNKIIRQNFIPILPTPAMRINTSGGKGQGIWVLHQTDEYLMEYDQRKYDIMVAEGHPKPVRGSSLRKKRQYEKYLAYKDELYYWSIKNNFLPPTRNFFILFKIPIPKTIRKSERIKRLGNGHEIRPDADNLFKGFMDAFLKRRGFEYFNYDDAKTRKFLVDKVWCETDEEGILITEYNEICLPI
jgi:Holliday junction resolvase RusA-like endonuclease